jgi:hypothetical protein
MEHLNNEVRSGRTNYKLNIDHQSTILDEKIKQVIKIKPIDPCNPKKKPRQIDGAKTL